MARTPDRRSSHSRPARNGKGASESTTEKIDLGRDDAKAGRRNGDEVLEEVELQDFDPEQGTEDANAGGVPVADAHPGAMPAVAATTREKGITGFIKEFRPSRLTAGASAVPLLIIFGLNAVDELDKEAFQVLVPEIRDWFGIDLTAAITISSLTLSLGLLIAPAIGYLSDRWNRTRMAGAGASTWGVFSFLTAFAPNFGVLLAFRLGSGLGKVMDPAHQALLADYYPPHTRSGIYAFHRAANHVGRFFGPLIAGVLAAALFWQAPFLVFAFPSLALAYVAFTKLREPKRGEQERLAMGFSQEDAMVEEKPPNWTESWRIARNVRTLRRIWYALPFLVGSALTIGILMSEFLRAEFGLGPAARGTIASFDELFAVAGLIIGGLAGNRFLRYRPGRVVNYLGFMAMASAGIIALMAVAPNLYLFITLRYVGAFIRAVFAPALIAIMSLVIPPRARGFALSIGALLILPGTIIIGPLSGMLADAYGIRSGILLMTPVFLIGAAIIGSAGSGVEPDMRQAMAAAAAMRESKRAKQRGQAKLLVCRDLDVHYGDVQVLFNVDFEVEEGELIALLGTNGAGKSTLLKAISGITPPSNGATFFDGEDITYLPANDHAARGIVHVPGGRGIFPNLTVAENLKLAGWMFRRDANYVREATERVLEFFPVLRERYQQPAGNLSGGEQQMLALGQAFLSRPRLLMIDELSLGLAPAVVEQLLEIVRAIHEAGTTIILVEQSVNVALTVANRAVFMEKGEVRFTGPTRDLLSRPDILRAVFLRGSGATASPIASRRDKKRSETPEVVLEVQGVSKKFGGVTAVEDVSLTLEEGKILGVIGPNGAGKTTVFDIISGFVRPDQGRIILNGEDITELGPDERARLGLQRSFQDARLFTSLTVAENIAVALERHIDVRNPVMGALQLPNVRKAEAKVRRRVERLIEMFNLGEFENKFIKELSTGSRRIADLACMVAAGPRVILLDEPSSGIAQAEAEELGPMLRNILYETGCSMLLIEHDMPLISSVSDELIALHLGAVVTRGLPEEVVEHETVVESYLGTSEEIIKRSGGLD